VATAALRRKKAYESELDKLAGTRLTLETQVNTIESANLNAETMAAMKKGADALKVIHGTLCVYSHCTNSTLLSLRSTIDKVDSTMEAINAQRELANEISEAISNPINSGQDIDEDELKQELADLESEELDRLLEGADRVPVHSPGPRVAEDGKLRQLRIQIRFPCTGSDMCVLQRIDSRRQTRKQSSKSCRRRWRCDRQPFDPQHSLPLALWALLTHWS
jgi:hypothetical protein